MSYISTPQGKDPELWKLAKRRASFKYHLGTYLVINIFLWVIWYLTGEGSNGRGWPWPVWATVGWGVGLAFHFLGAFVFPHHNIAEKEYERLSQNQKKQ